MRFTRRPTRRTGTIRRVAVALSLGGVAIGLVVALVSTSRAVQSAEDSSTRIARALDERVRLTQELERASLKLVERQQETIAALEEEVRLIQPKRRRECTDLLPKQRREGVAILQVAHVPESRGDDTENFAKMQVTRLRTLLAARGAGVWGRHLSQYSGRGREPVRRVVFNNVEPQQARMLCDWLRCEGWTGGCALIDERGETRPPEAAPPEEFAPSVDLYELWKVSALPPVGWPPVKIPG